MQSDAVIARARGGVNDWRDPAMAWWRNDGWGGVIERNRGGRSASLTVMQNLHSDRGNELDFKGTVWHFEAGLYQVPVYRKLNAQRSRSGAEKSLRHHSLLFVLLRKSCPPLIKGGWGRLQHPILARGPRLQINANLLNESRVFFSFFL